MPRTHSVDVKGKKTTKGQQVIDGLDLATATWEQGPDGARQWSLRVESEHGVFSAALLLRADGTVRTTDWQSERGGWDAEAVDDGFSYELRPERERRP